MSAAGTVIPDEDFSILVFRSGYYYPVFEDTDANAFSSRVKIYEGNCEEGILYMSTNSKGDIKYEVEYVNYGHHAFAELVDHNSQYHKQVCSICGETVFEEHTEYDSEIEKEAGHTEEGLMRCECFCGHVWTETIPVTDEHTIDYDDCISQRKAKTVSTVNTVFAVNTVITTKSIGIWAVLILSSSLTAR